MPPKRTERTTKRVDFVAKDATEQVATGIVMVPNKVDLQGDFERPETIAEFSEQFENFVESDEASGGAMHAVWPDGAMSLERNEVLEDGGQIGGADVPDGAWVQAWKFHDDGLWGLVEDDIFQGFSIGAVDVEWNGPFDEDELPDDVDVADGYDGEDGYWELVSGLVREVSTVDHPAVPDALIHETKAGREKRLGDHLGDRDGFIEEALQRGHSEEEAERMWEELSRLADLEGASEPGKESFFTRIGKAAVEAITGSDDGGGSEALDKSTDGPTSSVSKEDTVGVDVFRVTAAEDDDADYDGDLLGMGVDFPEHDVYVDWRRDAFPDALDDPHVSIYGSVEDLQQATGNEIESLDSVESPTDGFAAEAQRIRQKAVEETDNYAAGSDTPDDDGSTDAADDMGDTNDNDEPPEWADDLIEQTKENAERLDELQAAQGDDDPLEDAPEWAKEVVAQTKENAERIDAISEQTGATSSQQLGGAEKGGDDEGGLSERQEWFVPPSKKREARARAGGSR